MECQYWEIPEWNPYAPPPLPCPADAPHRLMNSTCIACDMRSYEWNDETKTCDFVHVYGHENPTYSYVYTYENKTTHGNITYPSYNITTTRIDDSNPDIYQEQSDNECPCDLGEYMTGENEINQIIQTVVESAVEQQAKLDYDQYGANVPEWSDPGNPDYDFIYEKDDDGRLLLNADGTHMNVEGQMIEVNALLGGGDERLLNEEDLIHGEIIGQPVV